MAEVVEKGPFDRKTSEVKAGVILEKIDGQALTPDMDYAALLNGCQGRKILVSFRDPQSGKSWDEVVKPISNGAMSGLLYERWVKQRAADVEKWVEGPSGLCAH